MHPIPANNVHPPYSYAPTYPIPTVVVGQGTALGPRTNGTPGERHKTGDRGDTYPTPYPPTNTHPLIPHPTNKILLFLKYKFTVNYYNTAYPILSILTPNTTPHSHTHTHTNNHTHTP